MATGMFSSRINHIINFQGLRTGTLRVAEYMQLRHIQAVNKLASLLEIGIRLASCAHDHIHANKGMRHGCFDGLDLVAEECRIISATHQLQHRVAATLQRDMKMRCEPTAMRHEVNGLIRQQVRLDRRDTITGDALHLIQSADQVKKALSRRLPEIANIYTG